jgi:hypothetical protein
LPQAQCEETDVAVTLDREDVEAIAQRVAELLRPRVAIGLVGVDEVVARFGVSRSYVYDHANELGAIRLGDGPKARLRFDLEQVALTLKATNPAEPRATDRAADRRGRPRRSSLPPGVKLIQGRGG